ncbi:hypothetical protein [Chryseobacterium sp. sg2396]|uniref:hypothetical protein n=1 Tax=Chryseobacterium sp. sg2396 TaxID=3276280 RepID=UPI0025D00717|nr:hypothetical protein [uncultured Chryseobacterium sp.]
MHFVILYIGVFAFNLLNRIRQAGQPAYLVTTEDKPDFEKLHLMNQIDEEDRSTIFKLVDKMLTTKIPTLL